MSRIASPTTDAPDACRGFPERNAASTAESALPSGLFVVLAAEFAAFVGLLAACAVAAEAYATAFRDTAPGRAHWGLLLLVVVGAGATSAILAVSSLTRGRTSPAVLLLTATVLYGTLFVGALAAERAAGGGPGPVIDLRAAAAPVPPGTAGAAALATSVPLVPLAAGDPVLGQRAFAASCAACHGAQGQGVPALAPGLREAPFVRTATDDQLRAVIVNGRTADAPDSVSQRLMPPRGGNPFLSDKDVGDIIAFLHEMASNGTAATSALVAAVVDPQTLIPRWVVPLAATGPAGLAPQSRAGPPPVGDTAAAVSADGGPVHLLYFGFLGLLAFHVLLATAVGARLLAHAWAGDAGARGAALARALRVQWVAVGAAWLVLLPLFYFGR